MLLVLNFNLLHLRALELRCFSSGTAVDGTMKENVVWLVELFARRRGASDVPCFVGNSCWIPFLQKSHESTSVFPDALFQASHQSRRWVPKQRRQPGRLLQDADVSINPCIPRDRTRLEAGLSSSSRRRIFLRPPSYTLLRDGHFRAGPTASYLTTPGCVSVIN